MQATIRTGVTGAIIAAGVAALALAATARTTPTVLPVGAVGDVAVQPAPFTERSDAGELVLSTGADGAMALTWNRTDGTSVGVDLSLAKQDKCAVDTVLADEYLAIDVLAGSAQPAVGLVDNGLGSRDQNNCNRSNGRVEDGQALSLALGSTFGANIRIDYAELDVEGKFGASALIETFLDGASLGSTDESLGATSDNDADSGGSDNNDVTVGSDVLLADGLATPDDDFDTIVIAPQSDDGRGQLSVEGGGDFGVSGHETVFHLVEVGGFEYTLVCYDPSDAEWTNNDANPTDGSIELISESPADLDWTFTEAQLADVGYPKQIDVFRYQGIDANGDPKPCDAIGANLNADVTDGEASVLLEPSDDNVNLRVQMTWVVPVSAISGADDAAFSRSIDTDGDGPLGAQAAQYCSSFDGTAWNVLDIGYPSHPADTPWCVLTDDRTLGTVTVDGVPIDVVFQTIVWDGQGDPRFY